MGPDPWGGALAAGGCRVLGGEETAQTYTGEKVFTNFDYLKA